MLSPRVRKFDNLKQYAIDQIEKNGLIFSRKNLNSNYLQTFRKKFISDTFPVMLIQLPLIQFKYGP